MQRPRASLRTEAASALTLHPKMRRAGEQQVVLVGGAPDHRETDLLRDLVAHLRQAATGYEKRNAHLRGLDHHFGGEPPRRVEDLVATVDAIQPHLASDR